MSESFAVSHSPCIAGRAKRQVRKNLYQTRRSPVHEGLEQRLTEWQHSMGDPILRDAE